MKKDVESCFLIILAYSYDKPGGLDLESLKYIISAMNPCVRCFVNMVIILDL